MPHTRDTLSKFIRQFVECEISYEHIRQKVMNKLAVNPALAFNCLDLSDKGHLVLDDLNQFLSTMNLYPAKKNIELVFERFDKEDRGIVELVEFE
jgi:hypothetical protein